MALLLAVGATLRAAPPAEAPATFCNPLDLDYRFQPDAPCRREAADPLVVLWQNEYWIFASKSGGYWHSPDFRHWVFVDGKNLPIEDYAPAVTVIDGKLYYTAFDTRAIYRADDAAAGRWTKAGDLKPYGDPAIFQDDDGRVYVYYGCSYGGGIKVVELDPAHGFAEIGQPVDCLGCDPKNRGWEVFGEENNGGLARGNPRNEIPWVEGSWMTKHAGKYYLQYAAPGTQFRSYADGVYVGDKPEGPFAYASYSPFSHKPTGFVSGAGHSGTFQDKLGNWWRIVTLTISKRQMFERRLGVFPVSFLPDGQMVCDTRLGDYPQFLPGTKEGVLGKSATGWMLLSHGKKAEASSTRSGFSVASAFDENIRTWWCAETGNAGEWLKVDLGQTCLVRALQINFADEGAQIFGKLYNDGYQYIIEVSTDGSRWKTVLDRRDNHRDAPHDYAQLDQPCEARYVRLTNFHCPAGVLFSVSGFRIFGTGAGSPPPPVEKINVTLNPADARKVSVSWTPCKGADFYVVRYGIAPDRLFNNYQVYEGAGTGINALNAGVDYWFTVDAVNENGCTKSTNVVQLNQSKSRP
jgi:hypothetical protein